MKIKLSISLLVLLCYMVFGLPSLIAQHIVSCQVIWSQKGKYVAFTTLAKHKGYFYCAFRQANTHVDKEGMDNGEIIILRSKDATSWREYKYLSINGFDLRDPKLTVDTKGALNIMLQAVKYEKGKAKYRRSLITRLDEARIKHEHKPLLFDSFITNNWLWDMRWIGKNAYGFLYIPRFCFVKSENGVDFSVVETPVIDGILTEASTAMFDDTHLVSVVRVNGKKAMVGLCNREGQEFKWYDSGVRLEAPALVNVGDEIYVCGRYFHDDTIMTSMFRLNRTTLELEHILDLPGGGDCSYPGLVYEKGFLYISYYNAMKNGASDILIAKCYLS